MNTTIYIASKPNCMACKMATRWLKDHGYKTQTVNLDDTLAQQAKNQGYTAAPILYTLNSQGQKIIHAAGYNPSQYQKLPTI